MAEIRKCIYVSIYISYTFSFLSLYISPLISDDSAFYLRKRIHIEHLSTNDEIIIKSRFSFVVPSRLFGHAPVYFRKWPLIQTALSLSFREGRCLLSRYRKSSSTRRNSRGRSPPLFPLPSHLSRCND